MIAALSVGCYTARYEPRAPVVATSKSGAEVHLESATVTQGLLVHGFIGTKESYRYRVRAPLGSGLVAHPELLCANVDTLSVDGERVEVGYAWSTDRWPTTHKAPVAIRTPSGAIECVAPPIPREDPRSWRRANPFVLGATISIGGLWLPRTIGAGGLMFLLGRWFDARYLGLRVGGGYSTCNASVCPLTDDRESEGGALMLGLEARRYNRPFRLIDALAGVGGYGVRVEEIYSWLPTHSGWERDFVARALATLHFGFVDRNPGWAGEPSTSRGMLDAEIGLGVAIARSGEDMRGGLATVLGLTWMYGR